MTIVIEIENKAEANRNKIAKYICGILNDIISDNWTSKVKCHDIPDSLKVPKEVHPIQVFDWTFYQLGAGKESLLYEVKEKRILFKIKINPQLKPEMVK